MLGPKRTKHRKQFRGRTRGKAQRGSTLEFGEYGIRTLEPAWITSRQIEAARRAITHSTKRLGKVWIRIFPDKPVTKKPLEVGMGGGKGTVEYYVAVIKPGRVLFEIAGVSEEMARDAMRSAANKLPVKTKFMSKG